MHSRLAVIFPALIFCLVATARGDEVILSNGDHLTGKVGTIAGGKMKFVSPALGEITIDMAQIKSFSTEEPAKVQIKHDGTIEGKITSGDASKITVEGKGEITGDTIKQINAPDQKWTGSVMVTGNLSRGNTQEANLGIAANAILRREDQINDDRFTLASAYTFSITGTGDSSSTTAENWQALIKYDKFFTPKFYGYGITTASQDHLADLVYRIVPGIGAGYQWVESPKWNFNSEAGFSYVFENHDPGGVDNYASLRLAYHFDYKLLDILTVFNNVQFLPAFQDFSNYNLYADAGLRTNWTKTLFSEFKVQYERDSTPAPGKSPNDYRFILGVGLTF